jgi:glycine amidinotransferase
VTSEPPSSALLAKARAVAARAYPASYVEEIEEDLEALCEALRKLGAKVLRPQPHDLGGVYATPFWASSGNNCYNARDLHLVVGNIVIESPSYQHSRYFEAQAYYPIWYEYFDRGLAWIAGPKPRMDYQAYLPYYRDEEERVLEESDVLHQSLAGGRLETLHKLAEREVLFEAANTLRMGRDLLYLVSSSGNRLGARWLQSVLGDGYRVHTTDKIYRSSHIDSTVMCLRPGLVLLNSTRVNERTCPPIFDRWEKLYFGEVAPVSEEELAFQKGVRDPVALELAALGFETNVGEMSSPWVGMNFLSVDTRTVIVEARQMALTRFLEGKGFTVVPVRMRHAYTQGGGIHCVTLDTVRESSLESYFD